jgi:FlaG/FlaF family flagellin (archaellin)
MSRSGPFGGRRPGVRRDERAVSTTLAYVLSLAIASLLISGLMIAAGGFVETEREQVVSSELEVVGQTLVADLEGADRLASTIDGTVSVRSSLPRRVGSATYTITLTDEGGGVTTVTLAASSVGVSVDVRLVTNTPVAAGTLEGGELVVVYDAAAASPELEVQQA